MPVSLNKIEENSNCFTKEYKEKRPIWKYYIRSFIDIIGFAQPVEYYNSHKRLNFEYNTLMLWSKYNLNVPKIIKKTKKKLFLSKIKGKTIAEIINSNDDLPIMILTKVFEDLNLRHTLAFKNNEPKLCHVDANLNNLLYSKEKIYHVDFEMGRENDNIEKWAEREISMLLMSFVAPQIVKNRKIILEKFFSIYTHKKIIKNLIISKIKTNLTNYNSFKKYSLRALIYDIHSIFPDIFIDIMIPSIKNILVIYSARFGDILMSTPTIKAIYEKWPDSKITFLTHPKRTEIVQNIPFIHKINSISNKTIFLSNILNKKEYDLAFVINNDNSNFVNYALSAAKYTIAFETKIKAIDRKLLCSIPYPKQHSKHSVDMKISLLSTLNLSPSKKQLIYIVNKNEKNWANSYLKKNNLKNKLLIGIQANSFHTKSYRDWPIKNFSLLCNIILKKNQNVHFLLLGSKDDLPSISTLYSDILEYSSLLAGALTLRETAAIMSCLNMYIGVDTGPTHIMGTMNIPMVVLYHSFNSSKFLKPLENKYFFPVDHPIKEHGTINSTMSDISVDLVYSKVEKALNK